MDLNALNLKFNKGKGVNFAAIRLPDSNDIFFVYSHKEPPLNKLRYIREGKPSFFCSPYGAGNLAFEFDADLVCRNEEVIYGKDFETGDKESVINNSTINQPLTKTDYTKYVTECVRQITSGKLKKVVAARSEEFVLKEKLNTADYFKKLCDTYPSACVYYFAVNGNNPWMGATPEKLMSAKGATLSTVALAGTLPVNSTEDWTIKERTEQSVTADFIRSIFKQNKLKGVKESEVKTIKAGEIQHLCSVFTWNADAEMVKMKFHKLLQELNPTPAVCGMPQYESSSFISLNEHFERRYYSGFIGFNDGKNIDLYVNLRCMELQENKVVLYAGAGITKDSDPSKEWEETEKKMQTLKNLF